MSMAKWRAVKASPDPPAVGNDEKKPALWGEYAPDFPQHLLGSVGKFEAMHDKSEALPLQQPRLS